jgi:hypothetical protein
MRRKIVLRSALRPTKVAYWRQERRGDSLVLKFGIQRKFQLREKEWMPGQVRKVFIPRRRAPSRKAHSTEQKSI